MKGGARNKALDLRHPFFRPVWRRLALVGALAIWTVVEGVAGNPYWSLLMGGIAAYAIYVFFFDFSLPDQTKDDTP